jgi:mycoredoxin
VTLSPTDPTGRVDHMAPRAATMYTTRWCAFCRRLKSQLARHGIEISEVDIEADPAAADFVMSVNDGNQTVPTVVFGDGSALTNPSAAQVVERLQALAGS